MEKRFDLKSIASAYAQRTCNGIFPIEYTRDRVMHHTVNDFTAGANEFRKHVLSVLKENHEACEKLTDEDKARSAQDILNETYKDLIFIFTD